MIIHSNIQHATFAHLIQTVAYEAGASNVFIDWTDEQSTKEFYLNAADSIINHFPDWQAARFKEWDDAGAAYIHIISENLDVFKEVSTERISRFQKASRTKLRDYHAKLRSHEVRWCLLAVPYVVWATKVFPNLSKEEGNIELKTNSISAPNEKGKYVYNVLADWKEGDVNYVFSIEVK